MTTDRETLIAIQGLCAAQLGTAPIPPPVVTPPVTPPITPPAGVVMLQFSTYGKDAKIQVAPGGLYAVKLPKIPAGAIYTTRDPASPPNMNVELAFSKTPGDFEWANTQVFYDTWDTGHIMPFKPAIQLGSIESNSLYWGTAWAQNRAKLDAVGEDWYLNVRVFNASGPMLYRYD